MGCVFVILWDETQKSIVCFQGFELVGIGVFSAGVSEDVSEPSALFFDGEEVVVHFLGVSG